MGTQRRRTKGHGENSQESSGDSSSERRAKPLKDSPLARGRQVNRQMSILRLLENARRGLTIAELHEALDDGCSLRTVYRDVEQLQRGGFRLSEEAGRWSAYGDTEQLKSCPLQPSEVLALLLSEDLLPPASTGALGVALQQLRERLMARLTPAGRGLVKELRLSHLATHAVPLRVEQSANHNRVLEAIEDASGREHCLRLVYETPGKPAMERVVEPHLFWAHAGRPYLVAYCRASHEFRTFAVQRIRSAEVLDEPFERRAEFEARNFVQRGFGMLQGEPHAISVAFTAEVAHLATERLWHPTQHVTEGPDGSVVLHLRAAGLPEVAAWVASFGGKVRVLTPEPLVHAVRALHESGLAACERGENADGNEREAGAKSGRARKSRTEAGRLTSDVNGWGDAEERNTNRC